MKTISIDNWKKHRELLDFGLEEFSWEEDDLGWLFVYEGEVITKEVEEYLKNIKHRIYESNICNRR